MARTITDSLGVVSSAAGIAYAGGLARPPDDAALPRPPMPDTLLTFALVGLASGMAGFIDAIVGGGGLILVPALFSAYPSAAPATLFGTNKGAAIWGTAWAARQYLRRVQLPWTTLLPAALLALLGSWVGAWGVTQVDPAPLKRALPWVLLAVLAYTLLRKDLGRQHQPRWRGWREALAAGLIGTVIGIYDGFFGPGTGSFFVFLFVRLLGYDFLHASASAKLLNGATNIGALILFARTGHVWWHLALPMATCNVTGSWLGTRMALQRGAGFVRGVFVLVVSALIAKTAWDAFGPG